MRTLWCALKAPATPRKHSDRGFLVGLVHLDRLKAPGQGGIPFDEALVFAPGRCRDGTQFSTRQ